MSKVISGLSQRNKVFSELSGVVVATSGVDHPIYIDKVSGRAGRLGFDEWSHHQYKPTGVVASGGSLTDTKYYTLRLVPVDDRRSYGGIFRSGNPTPASVPIQASGANLSIDYTIPVHPQLGTVKAGDHDGTDGASVLTDSTNNFGGDDTLNGMTVVNLTDGSEGVITANTATTITATLAGGTDDDWDEGDEYHVVEPECTKRDVYASTGDTASGASAGPWYYQTTIDNNTDTTYTLESYTASTEVLDTNRLAPPSTPSFCLSAFNRMWMFGGVLENTGRCFIVNSTDDDGLNTYDITIATSTYGTAEGEIVRYTLTSGTFSELKVGSYVSVSGGTMDAQNNLTSKRIIHVGSNYFDVEHDGVAEAGVTGTTTFQTNYIQGYTSGTDQTFFTDGMVGAQFYFEDDANTITIAWVDVENQRLGLEELYQGRVVADTATDYVVDGDTELFWSNTNDPHVFPVENVLEVPSRGVALAQIGANILCFSDGMIHRMLADSPEQGVVLVSDSIGCKAPLSVIQTPRGVLFFDGVSLNLTDGGNIQSLTADRADELLECINRDFEYNIRAVYLHEKDQAYMVFPVASSVNDWGLTVNLSNGDVFPERRNDVNAVWLEDNSDGQLSIYHGGTDRFTSSGMSYIYEHSEAWSTDDLPEDSDFGSDVMAVAGQVITVMGDGIHMELGDASTSPYQLEGCSVYLRSLTGNYEHYLVIESVTENALSKDGNALYAGGAGTGDTLFVGVDNLDSTGLAQENNTVYTPDEFAGRKIYNITDGSEGYIKTHTDKEFTVYVAEGEAESEDATELADQSIERYIGSGSVVGLTVMNLTDCSEGTITANTINTITATLSGGTNNEWAVGDEWVIKGLFGGGDNTWDGGSASAVGDEYQIGTRYDVTVSSDYDLTYIEATDRAYFCVIPTVYGWKWTDFGSPHLPHKVRRIQIDCEPTDGNWIVVEMAKDGIPTILRISEAWVDRTQTKAVFEFEMGHCSSFGYRIKTMGKNPVRIQNISIEQETIQ